LDEYENLAKGNRFSENFCEFTEKLLLYLFVGPIAPLMTLGTTLGLSIPIGNFIGLMLLEGIDSIRLSTKFNKLQQSELIESIDNYCNLLDGIYDALKKLNELKDIVNRSKTVIEIVRSKSINITSFDSLLKSIHSRIAEMREQFGDKDWDEHVLSLAETYKKEDFDSNDLLHCLCVLAYVYFLVEPNLHFEFLALPLFKIDKPWEIRLSEGGVKILAISPKDEKDKIPKFFKDLQQIDYELYPLANLWSAAAILKTFSFDEIPDLKNSEGTFSVVLNDKILLD
jgi:hypothetical protein